VFSLSLMGKNWADYLTEAHRLLQPFGLVFIAEPVKRWNECVLEGALVEAGFRVAEDEQRDSFRYITAMKVR
jgi:hypothetical protein